MTCKILVSGPGIEPLPQHWECGILITAPPDKSQLDLFLKEAEEESSLLNLAIIAESTLQNHCNTAKSLSSIKHAGSAN